MKWIFNIILILTCSLSTVYSQSLGLKGGLSVANLATNDGEVEDRNVKYGFTGGLFYNTPLGNAFALQPEMLYTQKGARYDVLGVEIETRSAYIELPVLFQLTLLDPFYLYAGPQLSYLVDVETTYNSNGQIQFEDEDDPDDYNRMDVGGAVGAGINFNNAFIDARLALGAIDFDKDRTIDGIEREAKNLKNINFQLTLGLRLFE